MNKLLVFFDMRLLWRQCSSSQNNANIKGTQEKDKEKGTALIPPVSRSLHLVRHFLVLLRLIVRANLCWGA